MVIKNIKTEALDRMSQNRYQAMLLYAIAYAIAVNFGIITSAIWWYGIILWVGFLCALAPFEFCMTAFYLNSYKGIKMQSFDTFYSFESKNVGRAMRLYFIRLGFTLLFTVLLIAPGIIYNIKTSMAFNLLKANPKMKAMDALRASSKIMKGHSTDYFKLMASMLGWCALVILSLGLVGIWVAPYMNTCKVVFYKREIQRDTNVYQKAEIEESANAMMQTSQQSVGDGYLKDVPAIPKGLGDNMYNVDTIAPKQEIEEAVTSQQEILSLATAPQNIESTSNVELQRVESVSMVSPQNVDSVLKAENILEEENIQKEEIIKVEDIAQDIPLVKPVVHVEAHGYLENLPEDEGYFDDTKPSIDEVFNNMMKEKPVSGADTKTFPKAKTITPITQAPTAKTNDLAVSITSNADKQNSYINIQVSKDEEKAEPVASQDNKTHQEMIRAKLEELKLKRALELKNRNNNSKN